MSSTLPISAEDEPIPTIGDDTRLEDIAPQEYCLRRTGDQPVVFEGTLVADASGVQINGRDRDRGHDVRVYRTKGGTYVVEIVYWTTWRGEAEFRTVLPVGREAPGVAAALRTHNPLIHVQGYPPADRFKSKQDRLLVRLREDFATRVSDVLASLPDAVERIK